jgi:Protein of unknown function (DUF2384)
MPPLPRVKDATKIEALRSLEAEFAKLRTKLLEVEQELVILEGTARPRVILPELHAGNGRIDAQKVADLMGIPLKQLAEGLELNYKAVHRNPSAAGWQEALKPVKRSLEILHEFFSNVETIRAWLNTPHPLLDDRTALETILEGKGFAVSRLLGNAWSGVPV